MNDQTKNLNGLGFNPNSRWSNHLQQVASRPEKPLPCCETYPVDTGSRIDDIPEVVKKFLHTIENTPTEERDKGLEKPENKSKVALKGQARMSSEASSCKNSRRNSDEEVVYVQPPVKYVHKFTEMEIVTLWNRFKFDFPTGNVNQKQLLQLFRQVFPRCTNSEEIVENLLLVFDHDDTGVVSFREMLILFSMSMDGTPRDKLHWAFRLYDQDGDDLLHVEDMIDIFKRLWRLAGNMSENHLRKKKEKKYAMIQALEALKDQQIQSNHEKQEKADKLNEKKGKAKKKIWKPPVHEPKLEVPVLAHKMSSRAGAVRPRRATPANRQVSKKVEPEPPPPEIKPEEEEDEEQMNAVPDVDPTDRAAELFHSLDVNSDGILTEEEFVEGCLSDPNFLAVLETFNCDFIWGV